MSADDPLGLRRPPPRFIPTLTEVVEGGTGQDAMPKGAGAEPVRQPAPSGVDASGTHVAQVPQEALVDAIVERALDELLARLADRLELHLAARMAQWRNEQAQQWVLQWLHAEMDGQLSDVRIRVEQLARELLKSRMPPAP